MSARLHSATAHAYFTVSGTAPGEPLATLALRNREKIFERAQKMTTTNLSLLDAFFMEHSGVLGWMRPQGGMTAFPWLNSGEDSRAFCTEVAQQGVSLAPGDCFSRPDHFRIGFAASGQFPRALERLSDFIRRRMARPPQPVFQSAKSNLGLGASASS